MGQTGQEFAIRARRELSTVGSGPSFWAFLHAVIWKGSIAIPIYAGHPGQIGNPEHGDVIDHPSSRPFGLLPLGT